MKNKGEIVLYKNAAGHIHLEVNIQDETVWLNRHQMAMLFHRDIKTVGKHINNIFREGELVEGSVVAKFATTASDNKIYQVDYYNLDVIISVGYRVKSMQGTQFRIWATQQLKNYIIKGFALNDDRFKTGNSIHYFNELQERIREIRLSERFFYQKIKDIYATSMDYNPSEKTTKDFFKVVQNKLLWAISEQTAAELIYRRADASLPLMGMQSLDKKNAQSIRQADACIAKNYLSEDEIKLLGLLVEQFLAFAETMAQQHTPMYMKDWIKQLDVLLQMNARELLAHAGKISHQMAIEKSKEEYQKYQDQQKTLEKAQNLTELEQDFKKLQDQQ